MEEIINYIAKNKEWIFSGIGVAFLLYILNYLFKIRNRKDEPTPLTINNIMGNEYVQNAIETEIYDEDNLLIKAKQKIKILFIDDDTKFKVVSILKKAGWINTRAVKDIESLDAQEVKETDIFFVDIQGVGLALECKDEGLGLALNLKRKYPHKKVVLYSAETKGERFHEALNKADASLPKNAEPYEFQQLVEQFSKEILMYNEF